MDLSKNLYDKVNVWKNEITEIKKHDAKLNWILKNHSKIIKFVRNKYKNMNSLRTYISALTSIMKALKGPNSTLYKRYSKEAISIQNQIQHDQNEQRIPENRKHTYVTFEEIERTREKIRQMFSADPTDVKLNQQYLVLCLYTYQPPIRREYKSMPIMNRILIENVNFIVHKDNKYHVYIRDDKVKGKHPPLDFEMSDELNRIIDTSLKYYSRR